MKRSRQLTDDTSPNCESSSTDTLFWAYPWLSVTPWDAPFPTVRLLDKLQRLRRDHSRLGRGREERHHNYIAQWRSAMFIRRLHYSPPEESTLARAHTYSATLQATIHLLTFAFRVSSSSPSTGRGLRLTPPL